MWGSAPFLIGLLRGPSSIVPYEIGQKFPMGISAITWQVAEVSFPAAGVYHSVRQEAHTRQLLEFGTRAVLFLAIPMCLILCVLASCLLGTWVGHGFPEAAWVLRLTTIPILAEAYAAISIQVLWAQGRVAWVLKLTVLAAVISVAMSYLLVPRLGAVGASVGLALGVSTASPCYVLLATRTCSSSVRRLLLALRPLSLPTLFAAVVVVLVAQRACEGWIHLGLAASSALGVYVVSLYLLNGRSLMELC
jgi:O-antigen/teichoic acid export membrane protein